MMTAWWVWLNVKINFWRCPCYHPGPLFTDGDTLRNCTLGNFVAHRVDNVIDAHVLSTCNCVKRKDGRFFFFLIRDKRP
jgi:hypothetical protein